MDPESKLPLLLTEAKNSLKHMKINIAANFTVLPECEFGFEDSLSLQTSTLSYEQVVVVSLQRCFVNVKHFIPQVEGHAEKKVHFIKKKKKTLYFVYSVQTVKPITHTFHQTIWQYERCSLVFRFPPHPFWLATESYFPPAAGKKTVSVRKYRQKNTFQLKKKT